MAHDVFISYSHHDKAVADAACARLEQARHRCWIAPRDVGAGEWGKAIIEGIRGAKAFVLIFSTQANRSPQVNREVERAVNHGLPIVPLRIEDIAPSDALEFFICNQHWLDALTPPLERHLDKLADMVGGLLGTPAPVWEASRPAANTRPGRSAAKAVASLSVLALTAVAAGLWLFPAWNQPADPAAPLSAPSPKSGPSPPVSAPSARAAAPQDESLLDLASIPNVESRRPDADGFLRNARVPVRIVGRDPPGTGLVLINSASLDRSLAGPDRNLLLFRIGGAAFRSSVDLEFEAPVARVSIRLPSFASPTALAVMSATAFGSSGAEIDKGSISASGPRDNAAGHTITLAAWRGEGIRRIRLQVIFDSDGNEPSRTRPDLYALIEEIGIRRIAAAE